MKRTCSEIKQKVVVGAVDVFVTIRYMIGYVMVFLYYTYVAVSRGSIHRPPWLDRGPYIYSSKRRWIIEMRCGNDLVMDGVIHDD